MARPITTNIATRAAFIAECYARPDDMAARHAFADWLEEQGESAEADVWRKSEGTHPGVVQITAALSKVRPMRFEVE